MNPVDPWRVILLSVVMFMLGGGSGFRWGVAYMLNQNKPK